ncbi:amidohydrolase [Paucibacter sp. APW11]|uniref:Amidohydrolase n=1 Tax=Roseateles aquae TaxID=3077235 RepID=A0ABU3PCI8_9BURK|nr:amidohydrolase [Paucibacter sp. APW11]MDT9000306.1 amidohydrolase [Paucibacter sp. APW11]
MQRRLALSLLRLACLAAQAGPAPDGADTIYLNGDIVTINDAQPSAAALAVRGGRIIAVGEREQVLASRRAGTRVVDLQGKTLLPGFVDAHGHVSLTGLQAVSANLLPPPDGKGSSIAALQSLLKAYAQGPVARSHKIVLGFGYDEAQLAERRAPTRQELDEVSRDLPVIIIHQSGHLGVLNSRALQLAGLNADSKDPEGGHIQREADGKTPNGVLEETAWFSAGMGLVQPSPKDYAAMLIEGQKLYARFGFTTGQDGRSDENSNKTWMALSQSGQMLIDLVSYPDITMPFTAALMKSAWVSRSYQGGFRIGGVKLSLDGSPQGKTAFLTHPYHVPPTGKPADYRGYPALPDQAVARHVDQAYAQGWQLLVHTNGDAASDQLIQAAEQATARHGAADRRTVMIHAQTVREDQLDAMQRLAITPSFFGMHAYYWGDWHRDETLGPVRGDRISPAMSALRRKMLFTQHHDAPVAFPDAIAILDAVVNRRTRSADILGPDQRLPVDVALKSITLWAAWQHFEEKDKGSLEVGKLADLVLLDKNPLKIPSSELRSIQVLETIKAGKSIYKAATTKGRAPAKAAKPGRA